MKRYRTLYLIIACLLTACLDPFLQDEKKITGNLYLLKNENHDISVGVGGDGSNYQLLTDGQVVEVFVADTNLYVKEIVNWNAIDTVYNSMSMTNDRENVTCDRYTYDSVKNLVVLRKGIIISGWHVPK
ncbi:hypothetical protein SAMN04488128_101450 [Chitinophaga eiseniae]|uniref:Lipoprotein n=1 Tax=Chitinophaga eiseniae TaxID=634771 RepID=A0A1T4L317_9BACT|nr:hypothetical protein [Chitinophaga eiseniae]SJZ49043.1 hypothetical protein SAMN04488128_101450 [Chitinophaga eiseniae]